MEKKRVQNIAFIQNGSDLRAYHLHRHLLPMIEERQHVFVCNKCLQHLQKAKKPPYSLANGFDFGNPAGVNDLPLLSTLEEVLICPVIPFIHVVTLTGTHGHSALKGHTVCLPLPLDKVVSQVFIFFFENIFL